MLTLNEALKIAGLPQRLDEAMSADQLRKKLEVQFPSDAKGWDKATDELVDLNRRAREALELGKEHSVDFKNLKSPAEWNTVGVKSLISFYTKMSAEQKKQFISDNKDLFTGAAQ